MTELWDIKRCAAFVGCSYDYFRKEVMRNWDIPQPLDKPGRPRWLSEDWAEWARKAATRQQQDSQRSRV